MNSTIAERITRIRAHSQRVRRDAPAETLTEGSVVPLSMPAPSRDPTAPRRILFQGLELLVLQPTPFCNIDCSYCYLPDRSDKARMSRETVSAVGRFVSGMKIRSEPLSVLWHCGEPTVVPVSFYREAFVALRETIGVPLRHEMQTNGTLIDDEWCGFLLEHAVEVSVSVDGPAEIHDARRRTRSGRGTFEQTMRGIEALKRHGIPFSVLGVITEETLAAQAKVCAFFGGLGAESVGFNVEEIQGANTASTMTSDHARGRLKSFLRAMIETFGGDAHRIREVGGMRARLTDLVSGGTVTDQTRMAGAIVSVDVSGNVSTFSPELLGMSDIRYGRFSWGSVHHDTWDHVVRRPGLLRVYRDIVAGISRCRASCPYFAVCGGGVPSIKWSEIGTFAGTETAHCRAHVQAVADLLIEEAESALGPEPLSDESLEEPICRAV